MSAAVEALSEWALSLVEVEPEQAGQMEALIRREAAERVMPRLAPLLLAETNAHGLPCCGHRAVQHSSAAHGYGDTSRCRCCNGSREFGDALAAELHQEGG